MKKLFFMFALIGGAVGLFSVFAGKIVNSQDNIRYNAVYTCQKSDRKFKVLRCDGGNCKVFQINEYNPNGGFESEMTREHVLYDISTYKCSAPGAGQTDQPQDEKPPAEEPNQTEETPEREKTGGKVACPASDPDSNGKTALEKSFRGAIRETWEKEPEPGLDGRVTLTFQAFRVGTAHGYRVRVDPQDAIGKSIYPVRATFTTCTDYNRRIETVRREREFSCYKNTAGEYACTIIAAPNTNVKDKTESIDKP